MTAVPKAEQKVQDPDVVLYRCWQDGRTPRATATNLRKFAGVDMTPEAVRLRFVKFSEGFS